MPRATNEFVKILHPWACITFDHTIFAAKSSLTHRVRENKDHDTGIKVYRHVRLSKFHHITAYYRQPWPKCAQHANGACGTNC